MTFKLTGLFILNELTKCDFSSSLSAEYKKNVIVRKNEHAMTLTELLVAVSIMGIVLVGTLSIDSSVHKMQRNISTGSSLSMKTSAAMLDITKNVSLMTGDALNLGYDESPTVNPTRFCIRQDVDSNGNSRNTPGDYTDDRWICYRQDGFDVQKCNQATPSDCTAGSFWIITTAISGGLQLSFARNPVVGSQILAIDVSLTNREDPSQAASLDNPEITFKSSILPLAQGFSSF